MTRRQTAKARKLVRMWKRARERGRAFYASADLAARELVKLLQVGEQLECDGEIVTIKDPFAEKDVVFGHGPVRRFEVVAKAIGKHTEGE